MGEQTRRHARGPGTIVCSKTADDVAKSRPDGKARGEELRGGVVRSSQVAGTRERDCDKTGAAANKARRTDADSCCSAHGSGCSEVARRRQVRRMLGGRVGRGKAKVRLSSMSSLSSSLLRTDARARQIGGEPDWEGTGPGLSRATGQGRQGEDGGQAGGVGTVDRTHPSTAGGSGPMFVWWTVPVR